MVKRRVIKKSSAVDSLLCSSRNVETAREQMLQIDDMLRQLMDVHKEYNSLLPLEAQEDDEKQFDDIDADMLVFKQKIHNWIRKAEQERDAELKQNNSEVKMIHPIFIKIFKFKITKHKIINE